MLRLLSVQRLDATPSLHRRKFLTPTYRQFVSALVMNVAHDDAMLTRIYEKMSARRFLPPFVKRHAFRYFRHLPFSAPPSR